MPLVVGPLGVLCMVPFLIPCRKRHMMPVLRLNDCLGRRGSIIGQVGVGDHVVNHLSCACPWYPATK